ncbi:MAG TPA: 2-amino-4-hydroxy-6-hydroxymethyldihydropteridine diphosphokinase [Actinomycetes bacterium]|nr:2-amino-4-hydroxy-6-hydroxymethyldihydropteridine diphosphokinase [Actinomycetes bacterium]
MRRAALSLGSNLGDRLGILASALSGLAATGGLRVVAVSSVYETEPVGGPEQGPYLNAVVVADTLLEPAELLERALAVEHAHGRVREVRWGARTLDVDVLSVGSVVSDDPQLTLPHPRAHERAFVLVPWAEVDPEYAVPGLERTVAALLAALPSVDGVRRTAGADVLRLDEVPR